MTNVYNWLTHNDKPYHLKSVGYTKDNGGTVLVYPSKYVNHYFDSELSLNSYLASLENKNLVVKKANLVEKDINSYTVIENLQRLVSSAPTKFIQYAIITGDKLPSDQPIYPDPEFKKYF